MQKQIKLVSSKVACQLGWPYIRGSNIGLTPDAKRPKSNYGRRQDRAARRTITANDSEIWRRGPLSLNDL